MENMGNQPDESTHPAAAELRVEAPRALGFDGRRLRQAMGIVEEGHAGGAYPGATALVIRHGRVAGWLAVGSAELEPNPRPIERDTLFDLASLTKVVGGLSAALLLLD